WDPRALALTKEPLVGVRREDVLGTTDERVIASDLEVHRSFQADRSALLARGSRPSAIVATVTARAGATSSQPTESASTVSAPRQGVSRVGIPRAVGRPRGARFGSLVHAILATVPLEPPSRDARNSFAEDVEAIALLEGRVLGATPAEVEAAAVVVK